MPRHVDLAHSLLPQQRRHRLQGAGLAVDRERPPDRPTQPADPGAKLRPVGVGRVAADALDLRLEGLLLPQDPHHLLFLLDPAPQRVLGLESHQEDEIAVIADPVGQVVENASRFGHARGRDDDHWTGKLV